MEPLQQKWIARALLLAAALAGLACLARLDLGRRISTDVLDLVPTGERSPELALLRNLAGAEQARVLLLALTVPPRPGEAREARAARAQRLGASFAEALAASPAIAQAIPLSDEGPRNALAGAVYAGRLELLLPGWLARRWQEFQGAPGAPAWSAWLAERSASDLEAYLSRPEAMATEELLPADPLLLVPELAGRMNGLLGAGADAGNPGERALVWARARASPLAAEGQGPVFAAVDGALARMRGLEPGTQLQWTGISRFAAASRARIEHEMGTLNLLSLGCVLAVLAACIGRFYRAANLVPVVLGSLLGAWVATAAAWQRVHVLVFVVGSLLAGVAVDYGFYLCLQPRRAPGETYREKASRLMRPLLASALTTVIGFSFLLWSELPLIRQLGVFVSAGLISALAAALLWFAQLDDSYIETRAFVRRRPAQSSARARRAARILLAAGAAVALLGPWRLRWRDDIRELEIPAPGLQSNDAAVRALFGETAQRTVYLTTGPTPADARQSLQAFLGWHRDRYPGVAVATLGFALPTAGEWASLAERLAGLRDFERDLRGALARHGFEPDAFAPFFGAWAAELGRARRPSYAELVADLGAQLQGPLASLLHVEPGLTWIATIAEQADGADPPAATSTMSDSELQDLNRLFSRYRLSALRLSTAGLAFVGASVFLLYGLRRGIRIFAIPAGACLFAFGLFGVLGATLNLFHLLGAFLGVCLSHNYAIFSAESLGRSEEPPPSIRMSAVAAASSFGVLALSRIPVVAALGSTVAVIVLAALAITELAPLASGPPADGPPPRP